MDDQERTLYCGNLSPDITEDILYELFLQAGPLERVKIPKDKDGRFRTYAFVTFKHEISVPYAISLLGGIKLLGRNLRLQSRTGSSGEGSGDPRGYTRTQSCPDGTTPEFQRINAKRAQNSHGHHYNEAYGRSTTEDQSGRSDVEVEVIRCVGGSGVKVDSRNNSGSAQAQSFGNKLNAVNASHHGMQQMQLANNSWHDGRALNQWQGTPGAGMFNNPTWVNGAQQVVSFAQPSNGSIFDPVIEQKIRERVYLLQQQDQVKRMQQFVQNQRLGPCHPFQRSENTWWQ